MIRFKFIIFIFFLALYSCKTEPKPVEEVDNYKEKRLLVDYVNPLMGTDSKYSLSK